MHSKGDTHRIIAPIGIIIFFIFTNSYSDKFSFSYSELTSGREINSDIFLEIKGQM